MHSACAFLNTDGGFVIVSFLRKSTENSSDVTKNVTKDVTKANKIDSLIENIF